MCCYDCYTQFAASQAEPLISGFILGLLA
jgi:hypothetical protein